VLAGLSAGEHVAGSGGVTRSSGPPEPIAGLGLARRVADRAHRRRARAPARMAWRPFATPHCRVAGRSTTVSGLLFRGLQLGRVVSSRPGAGAQRSTRSPASSCATASSPSFCRATAAVRWAASTRPSKSFAACSDCDAEWPAVAAEPLLACRVNELRLSGKDGARHGRLTRHRPGDRKAVRVARRTGRPSRKQRRATGRGGHRYGGKHHVVAADLTDPAQCARAVSEVSAALGPIDVLVSCAGVCDATSSRTSRRPISSRATAYTPAPQSGSRRAYSRTCGSAATGGSCWSPPSLG